MAWSGSFKSAGLLGELLKAFQKPRAFLIENSEIIKLYNQLSESNSQSLKYFVFFIIFLRDTAWLKLRKGLIALCLWYGLGGCGKNWLGLVQIQILSNINALNYWFQFRIWFYFECGIVKIEEDFVILWAWIWISKVNHTYKNVKGWKIFS